METAILSIEYIEGDQSTYTSVELRYTNDKRERVVESYATGNVAADYKAALLRADELGRIVMKSSTCDNFFFDGDDYILRADAEVGCRSL